MLIITIAPYKPIDNLEHYATSYQIATDATGTVILNSVDKSTQYLNLYPCTLETPLTTSYWYRYKRHVRDNVTTEDIETAYSAWAEYKPVANTSDLVIYNEISIDKPLVIVDKKLLEDVSRTTLTINTSDFRCNNDNHEATHWVIEDGVGNLLYTSLYDTTNKLSLTIDKSIIEYDSKSYLKIYVIHRSTTGVESEAGLLKVNVNESNFEISSTLTRIIPYTTCRIKLKKIFDSLPLLTIKYEVISTQDDTVLISKEMTEETTTIDIVGELLEPDSDYYLDIYSIGLSGNVVIKRKMITTIASSNVIKDNNIIFKKTITLQSEVPLTNDYVDNNSTFEDYNGIIPLVRNNDNKLYKGSYDRNTESIVLDPIKIFKSASAVTGEENGDFYAKMLDNSYLLIDTYVNTTPTFFVYRYDSYNDTCVLLHSMPRGNETKTLGYNNSVIVRDNEILYIPYGTKSIIRYDVKNNNLDTKNNSIPITDTTKSLLLLEADNKRLLVVGGNTDQCLSYSLDDNTFANAYPLSPDFRSCDLKAVSLVNGDALIFRMFKRDTDTEHDKVMYYDNFNNKMSFILPDTVGGFYPSKVVSLINGEVLLFVKTETHVKQYKFA